MRTLMKNEFNANTPILIIEGEIKNKYYSCETPCYYEAMKYKVIKINNNKKKECINKSKTKSACAKFLKMYKQCYRTSMKNNLKKFKNKLNYNEN